MGVLIPLLLLGLTATFAVPLAYRRTELRPSAACLCVLLAFDVAHLVLRDSASPWLLRVDAWIFAGGWCAVVAYLLGRGTIFFISYGLAAVLVGRAWPQAWLNLLIFPRLAVGALAWWLSKKERPLETGAVCLSARIGQIIAACQVASAAFLWADWGQVRILSAGCWALCLFVLLRR